MDFMTAVRTCLTQKYATFQGRASRSEYWWCFLAFFLGAVATQLIWAPLYFIFALAVLCPMLAVGFRRLQDTDRPGWWIVIPAVLGLLNTIAAPVMPTDMQIAAGEMPSMASIAIPGILGLLSLIVSLLFLWWLTRTSLPEANQYGPPPVTKA